jgi:competence protein ComEC
MPLIWPKADLPAHASWRMSILDVGHGLAVLVETRGYLLVYDTGARFESGFDIGKDVVLPALRGRRPPDTIIISHGDNDHSGGAAALRAAYPDAEVLTGPDIEISHTRHCEVGQRWIRDGVEFEILHPQTDTIARGNDSSCVLSVTAPGARVLLTGDIEGAGEAVLARRHNVDADVVVAPHHGSETSSTRAFVAATSPAVVIFSAGYGNRWDLPRESVVARWCALGGDIYVTGEQGAIEITQKDESLRVAPRRSALQRYWRPQRAPRCGESPGVTL